MIYLASTGKTFNTGYFIAHTVVQHGDHKYEALQVIIRTNSTAPSPGDDSIQLYLKPPTFHAKLMEGSDRDP
mgnify:CR=1 FL=1